MHWPLKSARSGCAALLILVAFGLDIGRAQAGESRTILQWFETRFEHIEHRMPDFFLAGYDSVWLPPVSRGADSNQTAGFDVFDRFDLGRAGDETSYGTAAGFDAVVNAFHKADGEVFLDIIMNHDSRRTGDVQFQLEGGYPGFWMDPTEPVTAKLPGDDWGDFHDGTQQSQDPGGANYDLFTGDLVQLIDIAQESNNQFIRSPVDANDPANIPPGTFRNLPDPNNARLYPDRDLPGFAFTNPGAHGNPGGSVTVYPFNTAEPMQGDAVPENATALLTRYTQWMLDVHKVDGFRLDAAKHIPNWFWDEFWDNAVYQRRTTPGGSQVTPFSFVESVDSNAFTYGNYVRKDGFGNRDALDLIGAGALRDLLSAGGFGSWFNVLTAHIDNEDDGFNNGTIGVNHVFSHDNGTTGDGGSLPPNPTDRQMGLGEHAYILLRTGPAIVYYNGRQFTNAGRTFYPEGGVPIALGANAVNGLNDTITTLVRIRNEYARGEFHVLNSTDPANQSLDDVIVFARRKPLGGGAYDDNLLVGINDRWDSGADQRSVLTAFPAGTRLHELTGNAGDPAVDPFDNVPDVLVVDGSQRVLITVPRNNSTAGDHGRGYVAYGPAVPSGTLSLTNVASTIAHDPNTTSAWARRIADVPVVTGDFQIQLTTTQTDPLDGNTDDLAVFRVDAGYVDVNGNGGVDYPESDAFIPGYENFVTVNDPLYASGGSTGQYAQAITAAQLDEGLHYLSVIAFRHRPATSDPLFREFRQVFYVDRVGPAVELVNPPTILDADSATFRVRALDATTSSVHTYVDLPGGSDPVAMADGSNAAEQRDRFVWRATHGGLSGGRHTLTVAALEPSGNATVLTHDFFVKTCAGDINGDGVVNLTDLGFLLANFGRTGVLPQDGDADFDGDVDISDLGLVLAAFGNAC